MKREQERNAGAESDRGMQGRKEGKRDGKRWRDSVSEWRLGKEEERT